LGEDVVRETSGEDQVLVWKAELSAAMADHEWRRVLQVCSWLKFRLAQEGVLDPEVEKIQSEAKRRLSDAVDEERAKRERQGRHRRAQRKAMDLILSGSWDQALDVLEALHRVGASPQAILHLLKELEKRLPSKTVARYRERAQRVNRLEELIGSG
jgi:hypothetical protein